MKNKFLLVDGHSVIFQWKSLSSLHGKKPEQAREQLVRILRGFQDASEYRVVVVFDGRGARIGKSDAKEDIQIFYSKSGQSADAIIERLTAKYASHHEITVVTDDNLERQTVISFGGSWISTDQFQVEIERAEQDLAERVRKHNARR